MGNKCVNLQIIYIPKISHAKSRKFELLYIFLLNEVCITLKKLYKVAKFNKNKLCLKMCKTNYTSVNQLLKCCNIVNHKSLNKICSTLPFV